MCKAVSWEERYRRHNPWVLALLALAVISLTLFSGGGVGLSDNGDYGRVMTTNSLAWAVDDPRFVYQDTFRMVFQGDSPLEKLTNLLFGLDGIGTYPSIHLVFMRLSLLGNLALNFLTGQELAVYHVQVLGAIYTLCWAGLLFLLFRSFQLKRWWADLPVKLFALFVLCDEGYTAYFNSLYSEPVQMVGLLAMAVFALRCLTGRGRWWLNGLWFLAGCLFYGWGKLANLPVGALCALCLGGALALLWPRKRRKWALGGAALCAVILAAVYFAVPSWMDEATNYNAVFYGVLKDTTPQQESAFLEDLGLPQELAQYADSNYYTALAGQAREDPVYQQSFPQVGKVDVLLFYLRHPLYFLQKLDVSMAHSGWVRPFYLSNLDDSHPRLSFAGRFGGWSWLRGQLPVNTWAFTLLAVGAGCLCLWRLLAPGGKKRKAAAALVLLALLGSLAYQFVIPLVTNGEGDLAKHMFAFVQLIDLLLLLLAACFGRLLCQLPQRLARPSRPLSKKAWVRRLAAPVAAAVLLASLGLSWGLPVAARELRAHASRTQLEEDAYVRLGSYQGEPLVWQVISASGGVYTLLAADTVADLPFETSGGTYGDNLWETSSLRQWLNGDFLHQAFTPAEQALLAAEDHRVLLSIDDIDQADSGHNDFFAFHIPAYSDRGAADAWAHTLTDTVSLPDITLLAELSRENRLAGPACWMETPYYNNGCMVRVLWTDGSFLMRDAKDAYGVRPVIYLEAAQPISGSGSISDPFTLTP